MFNTQKFFQNLLKKYKLEKTNEEGVMGVTKMAWVFLVGILLTIPSAYAFGDSIVEKSNQTEPSSDANPQDFALPEVSLGDPNAPVKIIGFFSLTCSHCSHFHEKDFPALKDKIDKGIVHYTFHDFPLDSLALKAAQLAWSKGPKNYPKIMEELFSSQEEWMFSSDPEQAMIRVAMRCSVDDETAKMCIADEKLMKGVIGKRLVAQQTYKIEATPALIINGKKIVGYVTAKQLLTYVDEALEAASASKEHMANLKAEKPSA